MATDTSTSRVISTPRTAATGIIRMPIWLCVVQIVLAYEWIISGLNKLLAPSFEAGLPQQIKQGVKGNPYQWYATFSQYGADGFATDETLVYYPGATR